jgi:signal transduction histidine kinase/DNA-binding response OmpR family regulator
MAGNNYLVFINSIRGKIIIASILACLTLFFAWGVSRMAFKRMLTAVEKISAPNDKLRLVNDITHKIARLEQLQKSEMLNNPANYYTFFKATKKIILSIDTLQTLFDGDNLQVKRISSLKQLLVSNNKLFIDYLKVREGLVSNKTFSTQVKALNRLLAKSAHQNDSAVTITEKKTLVSTITPQNTDSVKDNRGFFSKLFGKKKQQVQSPSYKVVDEEFNVNHDTLAKASQDSMIRGMGLNMQQLEKGQLRRSALFLNKEAVLNTANNKLIRRMLAVLKQVEAEALTQTALNNSAAKQTVNVSVNRINYIIIAFLILTVLLLYFILKDISRINQYRLETELARDEALYHGQAKQRFLSNMSHEIRTPLQSIIGYAELMKEQERPRKSDINAIHQSSTHLMQVVNEVLDYNRIISGKFTFTNQAFSMTGLLNEVADVLRFQAEQKNIHLATEYNLSGTDDVEGDPFRLKQVLYNIIGNAIKFTNKGEVKLTVACTKANKRLSYSFSVSDTGVGLSADDIKRIFNEFEQAQKPGPEHLSGTGLGLPISKALIENQGGQINVTSTLGKGSTFTFHLNFKEATLTATQNKKPDAESPNTALSPVWIVDDDNFILELCDLWLEKNHVPHLCFSSPFHVLNTPFDNAVKYIFLDIRMPEMSGIELCGLLKKNVPENVSIIALTAQVVPGEREHILEQGFDGLLMKPFKEQDLLALIQQPVPETEQPPVIKLDISKVEAMTFGDKRQLNKILKRFTEDCIDDIAELRLNMANDGRDKLALLVHRIAGRTAQIGAAELAADFRKAEIAFLKDDTAHEDDIMLVISLTDRLQVLIKQIRTVYLDDAVLHEIDH